MQGEGYCECGCGQKTRVAAFTNRAAGQVNGQPLRFINGHNGRGPDPATRYVTEDRGYKTPCWIWQGPTNYDGYGSASTRRGEKFVCTVAHRVVYEKLRGPIPDGLTLDHLCRNRICVNPDHLEPVTHRVNILRGQTIAALNVTKTHCPQGHPYAGDNLFITKTGWRTCRACRTVYKKRYREKNK